MDIKYEKMNIQLALDELEIETELTKLFLILKILIIYNF